MTLSQNMTCSTIYHPNSQGWVPGVRLTLCLFVCLYCCGVVCSLRVPFIVFLYDYLSHNIYTSGSTFVQHQVHSWQCSPQLLPPLPHVSPSLSPHLPPQTPPPAAYREPSPALCSVPGKSCPMWGRRRHWEDDTAALWQTLRETSVTQWCVSEETEVGKIQFHFQFGYSLTSKYTM